jgi:hypothetical protein
VPARLGLLSPPGITYSVRPPHSFRPASTGYHRSKGGSAGTCPRLAISRTEPTGSKPAIAAIRSHAQGTAF